ncbi:MAG: ribosome maturation factor RimM [Salibacter sp.]|uniref:ribosome maturation factor RimM n=1 Tax=Salibacter sp. TaxID=2010995 RepID=UPI002870AB79|nr:ribosome maturation factor RimM [Salibacter sp.]MDR9397868.1 ribosome maturation factor RimM [Salibacter sp.]
MNKSDCFQLGWVAKKHGFDGAVTLHLDTDFPKNYSKLESVFVEINDKLVPFFLEEYQLSNRGTARAKFEGIDNQDDAASLVGSPLFLPLIILPTLTGNKFYFHEVIGFKAIESTDQSVIGTIENIIESFGNPVFVIKNDNQQEIMIPCVDDFIDNVDRENKTLILNPPDGLLELYLND